MNARRPIKVWNLARDQKAHTRPVEAAFGSEAEFIDDSYADPAGLVAAQPAIVLCINDYACDIARCLDAAREARIPSLMLQDGILEWRCQYENPLFGYGGGAPQHQPVHADKIACLGLASARHIAAWGNADKVEITGMPRLDYLLNRKPKAVRSPGSRVLVMTAKNPGFTPAQAEVVIQSLRDLRAYLEAQRDLTISWRVSRSVAESLGVENQLKHVASGELADQAEEVDAVITTPSTAMLEAMLLGRPVAVLDYHNTPRFQQSAWTISAKEQFELVVPELLRPPAAKLSFQQVCLSDGLDCCGPAAERMRKLIIKMVESGSQGMAANLLGRGPSFQVGTRPPYSSLYPDADVFQATTTEQLQVRLARAENENRRLKSEVQALRASNGFGNRLTAGLRRMVGTRG